MLPIVLQSSMVEDWEPASYETQVYHTFDVTKADHAYTVESNAFVSIGLRTLKRVQNPYQLGRFLLKKEQKEYRGEPIQMVKYYHPINTADEEMALLHSCDVRRYKYLYDGRNGEDSSPKFYKNPDTAYAAINNCCENMSIIIAHIFVERDLLPNNAVKIFHDSERMPIFVAKV